MAGDLGDAIKRIFDERIVVSFTGSASETQTFYHPFGRQVAVVAPEDSDVNELLHQVIFAASALLPNFHKAFTRADFVGEFDSIAYTGINKIMMTFSRDFPEVTKYIHDSLLCEFIAYSSLKDKKLPEMVLDPFECTKAKGVCPDTPSDSSENEVFTHRQVLH